MIFCDTHCDFLCNNKDRKDQSSFKLYKDSDIAIQVFAIFVSSEIKRPLIKTLRQVLLFKTFFFRSNIFTNKIDESIDKFKNDLKKRRIYPILALEGLKPANYSLNILKMLTMAGVKSISLTWNEDNKFAGGVLSNGDLKPLGKIALDYIYSKNLCLDISHLNDKSFFSVLDHFDGYVMASHSNSRDVYDHPRNLTDKQIKAIVKRNGYIGINFFPDFLVGEGNEATSIDVANHIDHICQITGINNVGFGSDFSGIKRTPLDMKNCTTFYKVTDRLLKMNYSEDDIKKISYSNFYDFIIQFI